jgi:predicted amidophosphoribosyltransferase
MYEDMKELKGYDCPYCGEPLRKYYSYCIKCRLFEGQYSKKDLSEIEALDKLRSLFKERKNIDKMISLAKPELIRKIIAEEL